MLGWSSEAGNPNIQDLKENWQKQGENTPTPPHPLFPGCCVGLGANQTGRETENIVSEQMEEFQKVLLHICQTPFCCSGLRCENKIQHI